ncbi:MAG: glycosyltransferase family 4 protein [Candidatus Thorarchaeota archaeon]
MAKNILYIVYSLEIGGLERVVLDLANNLPANDYNTHICCINKAGDLSTQYNYQDRLFVINNKGRINLKSVKAINDIVHSHSIDLIHSHNFAGLLYGYPVAKYRRIPIVHTEHGFIKKHDKEILNIIEKHMSRTVNKYVCVSKQLADTIHDIFIPDDSKITIIYNGITLRLRKETHRSDMSSEIKIGSIGRLTHIKNYELLIKSFSKLVKEYPSIRLEIVGDGEIYQDLLTLIDNLSLKDKVSLPGFRLNVDQCLENMDIFVLPSFSEGHSISLLEALSKNLICIASDVGGNPEIIANGMNGYTFESNNLEELTERLSYSIENINTEEMEYIRKNGFETIRTRFSLEAMLENYNKLYTEILR